MRMSGCGDHFWYNPRRSEMANLKPSDLLLAPRLEFQEVAEILRPYGFSEIRKADANLQAIGDEPHTRQLLAETLEELLGQFAESADPDQALSNFERFTVAVVNKTHLLSFLSESARALEIVAKVFGGSHFMSEILIRDPLYLYWIADPQVLNFGRTRRRMTQGIAKLIEPLKTHDKKLDALRIFKRKEILHVGVRDLLKLCSVEETLSALSALAEVLIQTAYKVVERSLRRDFGMPFHAGPRGKRAPTRFSVIGLGKLGGGELNFSSDVDLMYLYDSDEGQTEGGVRGSIANGDYFKRMSQQIASMLSEVTNEGYVYRVDLRLRPEGKAGPVANSLESLRRYYGERAEAWERLALLKAWPVAGDRFLGTRFINLVRPFIYGRPLAVADLEQLRRIKRGIDREVSARRQQHRNVKLGFGGIREIEFVVQSLQVSHGKRLPGICCRSTLDGLRVLFEHQLLGEDELDSLSRAYVFLRDVENKLQMVLDLQTHVIPDKQSEVRACALRLGYKDGAGRSAEEEFLEDHRNHTASVNRIFRAILQAPETPRLNPDSSNPQSAIRNL